MTIKEIAKLANVSSAAVSRFLNRGSLSAEKSERIRQVIEETGYRPNPGAQMLRTKKMKQIGVIVPKINSHSVAAVVAGISEVLGEAGYLFTLADTDNREQAEVSYLTFLQENRAAGVILIGTMFTREHEELFQKLTIPAVIVGQRHERVPCVYHDDFTGMKDLTRLMIDRGRRHFAYIGVTERDVAAGRRRREGVQAALREAGIPADCLQLRIGGFAMHYGYEIGRTLLTEHPETDAILCATDSMATGVLRAAKELGRRIPEEISLAGVGDGEVCLVTEPMLTSLHLYYEESGRQAATMLLGMLEEPEAKNPVKQLMLNYELKQRDSV